jgi:orotidine-5'-phosphate decarboxylase
VTRQALTELIFERRSYLCVGLDAEIAKLPPHLLQYEDPVLEFNKQIIDATRDLCVAYKPNLAFYEALGAKGWQTLEKTRAYIGQSHFTIADAKRGDIGNTSGLYAKAFFETLDFDAVTVAPYMGSDSVLPFLAYPGKWVILLALTSNKGSGDFQFTPQENGQPLYIKVIEKACAWAPPEQLMFVVGATHPNAFAAVRRAAPSNFLLVPGVGAQGGDLESLSRSGLNADCGMLVNASRSILYAGNGEDFAEKARQEALSIQQQMDKLLNLCQFSNS